jgi:hypothetical protein
MGPALRIAAGGSCGTRLRRIVGRMPDADRIEINRAPVMTLWATVVAERLGYARDEALTLGRAVAGLNAYSKAKSLGLVGESATDDAAAAAKREPPPRGHAEVELLHRRVLVKKDRGGLRAVSRDAVIEPRAVERYLAGRFGDALPRVTAALERLAESRTPAALRHEAYALYERFRPDVPAGKRGWGATGVLDLARIDALAAKRPPARRAKGQSAARGRGSTKVRRASGASSEPRG